MLPVADLDPALAGLVIAALSLPLLWQMSLIPEELRWVHRYEPPEDAARLRPFRIRLPLLSVLAAAALTWAAVSLRRLDEILDALGDLDLVETVTSPYLYAGAPLIAAEIYFGALLVYGLLALADATAPAIPRDWLKWVEAIALLVAIIGTIAAEILSILFPPAWWTVPVFLLLSLLALLALMWAAWVSNPNNLLRVWFCRWIAPHAWTPIIYLLSRAWDCLKWGWIEFWGAITWLFWTFIEVVVYIWTFVTKVVQTVFTYVKRGIRWVEQQVTSPTWMPGFLKTAIGWFVKIILVAVEFVEVVVQVVTHILLIPVLWIIYQLWAIATLAVILVLLAIKLVCLLYGLVALWWSLLLVFLWSIPVWIWRILFLN